MASSWGAGTASLCKWYGRELTKVGSSYSRQTRAGVEVWSLGEFRWVVCLELRTFDGSWKGRQGLHVPGSGRRCYPVYIFILRSVRSLGNVKINSTKCKVCVWRSLLWWLGGEWLIVGAERRPKEQQGDSCFGGYRDAEDGVSAGGWGNGEGKVKSRKEGKMPSAFYTVEGLWQRQMRQAGVWRTDSWIWGLSLLLETAETLAGDSMEVRWCTCTDRYEQERGEDLPPCDGIHYCQVLDTAFNSEENSHQLWNRRESLGHLNI